ncbi:MAG TPA: pseudouridine-5'-phosphate glycosidase [Actinomycetes bacterium]|nr:pseudouridine-5'-phosphate glycosidase [Actinomycetes bacterium]
MEPLRVNAEVAAAVAERRPLVALESTIIAHGLPRPQNLDVARGVEQAVRELGATPATIAVLGGTVTVGLSDHELVQVAERDDVAKLSVRDLGPAVAAGRFGATTVSATARIARHVGIGVMATGGLGGVHREARNTWDESPDLTTLGSVGLVVVCAGVKSILDIPATLERLETLNVVVLGYRTRQFPAFYLTDSGLSVDWQVDSPTDVADVVRAREALGAHRSAVIVANPLAPADALDREQHEWTLRAALSAADRQGLRGKAVTPFLLEWMHRETKGASLEANSIIIRRNAELAAEIAVELARAPG